MSPVNSRRAFFIRSTVLMGNLFNKTFMRVMVAALAAIVVNNTFNIGSKIRSALGL